MLVKVSKFFSLISLLIIFLISSAYSNDTSKIEFIGNERIPSETILMLSKFKKGDTLDEEKINQILINLYESNFFKDIQIELDNNVLRINVLENPLIDNINFEGVKAKKNLETIKKNLSLKSRSSYSENLANADVLKIKSSLKELGYYFSNVELFVEELNDNQVNLNYKIDLGNKAKIKRIKFIGDKKYKDSKLKNIIISEEYKFWKFISGKKYLNEQIIKFDKRLLRNFYLNKGYYDVNVNSSFAKLLDNDEFEIIYNINANNKFYFNDLKLDLPSDFNIENFRELKNYFKI